jgi:hypothetical protein
MLRPTTPGKSRFCRPQTPPAATILAIAALLALIATPAAAQVELYVRQASLSQTMLAVRAQLERWLAAESDAGRTIRIGPWYCTTPGAGRKFDAAAISSAGIAADPRWTKCAAAGAFAPKLAITATGYVFTTIHAAGRVALSVEVSRHERFGGFGYRPPPSGAGVEPASPLLWLNGRPVVLRNRLEGYQRVPVAKRRGWHEAVLADVPLEPGENRLVVALGKGPQPSWFNAVRLSSDVTPVLWAMIENDFPRRGHHLLDEVSFHWFDASGGWFASGGDPRLEREFVAEAIEGLGPRGESLRRRRDRLAAGSAPAAASWLELCVAAAELQAGLRVLDSTAAAIENLAAARPGQYPAAQLSARIAAVQKAFLDAASAATNPDDACWASLFGRIEDLQREALITRNPLLAGKKLLFVKRSTYDSNHYYDEFVAGIRRFGGGLFTLSLAEGRFAAVSPSLAEGLIDRYDLSFDARRVVFDYKRAKPEGFRIYEMDVDGGGLRQLTFPPADEDRRIATYAACSLDALRKDPWRYGHWTDDMHPCYLPDGRVVFTSTRGEQGVLCGGHSLTVANLHRIDGDGRSLTRLSQGALSEFCPTVMNDGRVLYNRWEYVDKGAGAVQALWAMCPDGSRSEEIYGNNITTPPVFNQPRQVPGCNHLVVCLGAGHSPGNVGAIVLVDLHKDKRTTAAMTVLTPGSLPKGNWGLRQFRNGRWLPDVYGPWYCDPFPLGDAAAGPATGKFFLVSCNPEGLWNDPAGYGIYLLDAFGNRVPIYRDAEISCFQARPLEPRLRPPLSAGAPPRGAAPDDPLATVVVSDVYQGLDGVARGTVKYLRVMEQVPRPWSVYQGYRATDAAPGEMVAVSLYTHLSVKVLHGVAPVYDDGSACFRVPARRDIFLQALDKDFMEVQRMRTFVNFQPGEWRSCVGCHETRNQAPVSRPLLALRQPPALLAAQPGETAPRPLHYPTDVQPIFDRHCVACHNSQRSDGDLDLSGQMTVLFCRSYEAIIRKDLVGYIQEFVGPKPEGADAMGYAAAAPPYTYGSHKSKLISVLRAGHYDVKLTRAEFIRLATWVDANAPYYGSYFGRRNILSRDGPDFRPVPTLESALGIPPPHDSNLLGTRRVP